MARHVDRTQRMGQWVLISEGPYKEIVRRTGHSRGLARQVLRGQRNDVFRSRESSLETYLEWLDAQWAAGKRNATELWRRLRTQGFRGSRRVVSEWATRRKRAEKADAETLNRIPSARTIARLLTTSRDNLTKSETVTIAAIEGGVPLLVKARDIIADFHSMIRRKAENELAAWIDRARESLVASFGNGVAKDIQAVRAAIGSPWSNGQTEGQITKFGTSCDFIRRIRDAKKHMPSNCCEAQKFKFISVVL
ncbi:MAG: transposase [Nitrospira sp.]|nr:transposase [Nitrospira sp.]